jgi:ribosome-binding protein aMBF1 (putative translation factor)
MRSTKAGALGTAIKQLNVRCTAGQKALLLTSDQIGAARALVRWSAEDLARRSSVSLRIIRRAELADHRPSLTIPNDLAIRRALELASVEFIDENGGGPGVRLRKK